MESTAVNFDSDFSALLATPKQFVLDLHDADLETCINEYIKYRSVTSPKIAKQFSSLRKAVKGIIFRYHTTLKPIQITDIFWAHFIKFLIDIQQLQPSSASSVCSRLKCVLVWASKHSCPVSTTFEAVKFPKSESAHIALTPDEISHIYHFDLSRVKCRSDHRKNLEKVRDTLVLSCSLGQRYSDLKRIDPTCFERNMFKIVQQKTGNTSKVDINKLAIDNKVIYDILKKYNYEAPYHADIANYNKMVHELLRIIGGEFNDEIKTEYKINGQIKTIIKKKWQSVASHTGRRTFVTNNIYKGVKEIDIMKGTGHHSSTSFYKYICDKDD